MLYNYLVPPENCHSLSIDKMMWPWRGGPMFYAPLTAFLSVPVMRTCSCSCILDYSNKFNVLHCSSFLLIHWSREICICACKFFIYIVPWHCLILSVSITVLITGPVTYYLAIPTQITKSVFMLQVYNSLSLYNQRLSCLVLTELNGLPWKWNL